MQAYFDRVYDEAHAVLKAAGVRPVGPARCYYFTPLGETVDLASGFPVRMDTVNKLQESLDDTSPFKVVRHGDLRTWQLRSRGDGNKLSRAWEVLADHVRESHKEPGDIAWEDYVSIDPETGDMTVNLHWAQR